MAIIKAEIKLTPKQLAECKDIHNAIEVSLEQKTKHFAILGQAMLAPSCHDFGTVYLYFLTPKQAQIVNTAVQKAMKL